MMKKETIFAKIQEIIHFSTNIPLCQINNETDLFGLYLSSLEKIDLLMLIEDFYEDEISIEEARNLKTVQDIVNYIYVYSHFNN